MLAPVPYFSLPSLTARLRSITRARPCLSAAAASGGFDDEEPAFAKRGRHRRALPSLEAYDATDGLRDGDRWSTWDQSTAERARPPALPGLAGHRPGRGGHRAGHPEDGQGGRRLPGPPRPCPAPAGPACWRPSGTGRPSTGCSSRDSAYLEGRRVRDSRVNRAMAAAQRGRAGDDRRAVGQRRVRRPGPAVPGRRAGAVPGPGARHRGRAGVHRRSRRHRRAAAGRDPARRPRAGRDCGTSWSRRWSILAGLGLAHGDLSAYNLLVHRGRLVIIDLPQVIDVIAHPRGAEFLDRDAANVARWFTARGLAGVSPGPEDLPALLRREARLA